MTNFKKQIFSVVTAGAMVVSLATPVLATGTTIEITGNGSGSDNSVAVQQTSANNVSQSNSANVTNNVNADAKSGGNDASFNTGGNTTIDTGKASTNVDVANTLNSNSANVDCCASGNTNVKIDGNGAKSDNTVNLTQTHATNVNQTNSANVTNNVDANANSGGNDAKSNTGGDVTIKTGKASTDVDVSTLANVNSAKVGGGMGGSNPSASFVISGNGSGSDNKILAGLVSATNVGQDNSANVTNNVDADAKSGGNDAGFNTGGDVAIMTGNASTGVEVDNAVNFNFADVDCGCTWDVLAKIAGNGANADSHHKRHHDEGENYIGLNLTSAQNVGQGNGANLSNNVDGDAKTGYNDAGLNTGEANSDPSIMTGNADSSTGVSNSGNVNSVGDSMFDWPDMPAVDFSFNFAALWAFFGMHI